MTDSFNILVNTCLSLEQRCEQLESMSQRSNIIIHNLPPKAEEKETWEGTKKKAHDYFTSLSTGDVKVEGAHRLSNSKKDSPVIVKMTYNKVKGRILAKVKDIKRKKEKTERGRK